MLELRSKARPEEKWDSANGVVVSPGGWCCSNCCWCWVGGAVTLDQDDEEL